MSDPGWWGRFASFLTTKRRQAEAEVEQLRVQLAGCSAVALGYDDGCTHGMCGYSASLEDVRMLRLKYDKLQVRHATVVKAMGYLVAKIQNADNSLVFSGVRVDPNWTKELKDAVALLGGEK